MAIGYGAGVAGNPTAKKRKLPKVETFRDIQNGGAAGPSATKPSGVGGFQPGGFGPAGVGGAKTRKTAGAATKTGAGLPHTTSGYTAPATPTVPERTYSEASQPPAAGFGAAPSPVFGAGALPSFATMAAASVGAGSVEGVTEAGRPVPTASGYHAWGEAPLRQVGEAGLGAPPGLPLEEGGIPGAEGPADARLTGEQPGLRGVAAEEAAGGIEARDAAQTLDEEMQGLIDDHGASWGSTEEKLNAQLATAMRRQAEMNAAMGSSVAGGFAGATAATILGSLQVMADAFAAHQKEGRNLQLAWLEKRMNMDFQREMEATQTARTLLGQLLSDPNAEISEEDWAAAYPDAAERAEAKEAHASGEGLPSSSGSVEGGDLKNAEGHLYMGADGLGTSGKLVANPYGGDDGDFTERQWFAEPAVDDKGDPIGGQYKYYYKDEDGNKRWFTAGVDGGAYPGDKRASSNRSFYTTEYAGQNYEVDWGVDQENTIMHSSWGDENGETIDYFREMAPLIAQMFMYEDPTIGAAMVTGDGDPEFNSEASEQAFDNFRRDNIDEVSSFMFATLASEGRLPTGQELQQHFHDLNRPIVSF